MQQSRQGSTLSWRLTQLARAREISHPPVSRVYHLKCVACTSQQTLLRMASPQGISFKHDDACGIFAGVIVCMMLSSAQACILSSADLSLQSG